MRACVQRVSQARVTVAGEVTGELYACICGACGFTELYATNLDALVKTALAANPPEPQPEAEPQPEPQPEGG